MSTIMRKSYYSFIAIMLFVLCSCKHDEFGDFQGEQLCPSAEFEFEKEFAINKTNIDFKNGDSLVFSAIMNEPVSWTIKIEGKQSGATKSFKGSEREINLVWKYGRSDTTSVFFTDEECSVTFDIPCVEALNQIITANITANTFENFGTLVSDFEGNGQAVAGWYSYVSDTALSALIDSSVIKTNTPSPQGGNYHVYSAQAITGAPVSVIGGHGTGGFSIDPTWNNPEEVYMNFYINGDGTTVNGSITLIPNNADPVGRYAFQVTWTGWRMLSIPLSDFTNTEVENFTLAPEQIGSFELTVTSGQGPTLSKLSHLIDFVIFTEGGSFYTK